MAKIGRDPRSQLELPSQGRRWVQTTGGEVESGVHAQEQMEARGQHW